MNDLDSNSAHMMPDKRDEQGATDPSGPRSGPSAEMQADAPASPPYALGFGPPPSSLPLTPENFPHKVSELSPHRAETDRLKYILDTLTEKIRDFNEAYSEDFFTPLPSAKTESSEMQSYRSRASAAMGRHMSRFLLAYMRQLEQDASHA